MVEFSEGSLRANFEEFLDGRRVYKVDCGGRDTWGQWRNHKRVEYPVDPDESSEFLSAFQDLEVGDIILAQHISNEDDVEHTFGFGVVANGDGFSDTGTVPADPETGASLAFRTSWVTVANNGEHITADVPAEFPNEPVTEVAQEYFEDLLEGLEGESYPPEVDVLLERLFAAAARSNLDEIIDSHFPSTWRSSPDRARMTWFVVEEYLRNSRGKETPEDRLDTALIEGSISLEEDPGDVEAVFEEAFSTSMDKWERSTLEHALERIEVAVSAGAPWENTYSQAGEPELFLMPVNDEWLPHFQRTVDSKFELDTAAPDQLAGHDALRVWGTKSGERNEDTFESLAEDDIVLYYKSGMFIAAGRVDEKFEGRDIGEYIWDNPNSELVYTLKEYTRLGMPAEEVRDLLEYDEGFSPQGFTRVYPDRTDKIRLADGTIWSLFTDYVTPELGGELQTTPEPTASESTDFDLAEWLEDSLSEDYEYFILKTDNDDENNPWGVYHFDEEISGSSQLRTAAPNVRFVYLEDGEFYAVGSLGDVDTGERDGESYYFTDVTKYHNISPIPRDAVQEQLSITFPVQHEITSIEAADYQHILGENTARDPRNAIETLLEQESGQVYLYREALAHLIAGKNIVFYGPPGTGKTRAARKLSEVVCAGDYSLVTANAEWSNYQVVGGYAPSGGGFAPQMGFLTEAAADCQATLQQPSGAHPSWLLIDELNRANLDEAFGDVFTLLDIDYRTSRKISYAPDADSVAVPLSFRILATMNTYDQAQLFSLGYAFRRRFAFVRVPSLMAGSSQAPTTSDPTTNLSQADLSPGSKTTISVIRGTITDDLLLGVDDEAGVSSGDVAAVLADIVTTERIEQALDELDDDEVLRTGSLDWLQTLVYFAQEVMARDVIDIGQALLIDATKYVVAHKLLFPDETDRSVLDQAVISYLVPQFEHFMPELRRAETIDQDSSAGADFDAIIDRANELGLPETAAVLRTAKEDKRVLE